MTKHEAAIWYAMGGWNVFPLVGKKPITRNGYKDATTDTAQIHAWWTAHPEASIGIACRKSGIIAFDADVADGKTGVQDLKDLETVWGDLPRECWATTARDGLHVVMADPSPGPEGWTRNRDDGGLCRGKLTPSIDVKNNGYIVVEPSDGYDWQAHSFTPPPVPENWIGLIQHETVSDEGPGVEAWETGDALDDATIQALAERLGELRRDEGNSSTFKAIKAVFHDWSLSVDTGWPLLLHWNAHCGKPHTLGGLGRQVCRVADREMESPRGWARAAAVSDALVLEAFEAVARPKAPPTRVALKAQLQSEAKRIGRKTSPKHVADAKYIRTVIKGHALDDEELVHAARAVWRYAPIETTARQVVELMMASCKTAERAEALIEAVPQSSVKEQDQNTLGTIRDAEGFELDPQMQRKADPANTNLALQKLGVSLSYDLFLEASLISRSGTQEELTDDIGNGLWFEIDKRFEFKPNWDVFNRQLDNEARKESFHSVCDYLDTLTWDGDARIDEWLINYAGAEDTPFVRAVSGIVLMAAVRRVRQPGCKFDEMLVLEDPNQGTSKSTALKTLAVNEKWFSDDMPLGASTRERMERMSGHWIMEAGELQGMRKGEVTDLKAFLSRAVDKARMSYGRRTTKQPRQCVIIGTTNDGRYLKDTTGNRRFWPVRVHGFDVVALLADRDQLWAEAAAREEAGESIRLDETLWAVAAEVQEDRRVIDPFEEALDELLADYEGVITSADLWMALDMDDVSKRNQTHVTRRGQALTRLGWERTRARVGEGRTYCYKRGKSDQRLSVKPIPGGGRTSWRVVKLKTGVAPLSLVPKDE